MSRCVCVSHSGDESRGRRESGALALGGIVISVITAGALALVIVCSVVSSLLVPGGVIPRLLGLAVVTRSGAEVTRARSVARVLVAFVPAAAWFVYLAMSPRVQGFVPTPASPLLATGITLSVLAAGAIWTIAQPARGPHDRLLGTWVVPR